MQRLEPWLLFLSILAILFLPYAKGLWWLILLGLAIGNTARRWNEAWTWFSLESMREMLRAILWVPGIILIYFTLHSYAPMFVHASPSTAHLVGKHKMVVTLRMPNGKIYKDAWLYLRVDQKRSRIDLFGEVLPVEDSARALFDFEAVASFGDYIRSSLGMFRDRIPFTVKRGHIPWSDPALVLVGSGWISFNPTGKPLHLSLKTRQNLSLED